MSISDRFLGFRFNSNNGFDHLARAIANGAVADNLRTTNTLPKGATFVVLAKVGDEYLAASGVTLGEFSDSTPQEIWPAWSGKDTSKAHRVIFKTQICKVPVELARRCDTTAIREVDAAELAYYCFANG
jgi:hypothetical protein